MVALRAFVIPAALVALLLASGPAGAASGSGTSSTGNVDTWGIGSNIPSTEMCVGGYGRVTYAYPCGLLRPCTQDILIKRVTLTLLDPTPGDIVSLTVTDNPGPAGLTQDDEPLIMVQDVATYDKPVADVWVTIGGCNRVAEAIVTGVLVDGEVSYTIDY